MNFTKQEELALHQAVETVGEEMIELTELQLLVVGGGCGEVIFG